MRPTAIIFSMYMAMSSGPMGYKNPANQQALGCCKHVMHLGIDSLHTSNKSPFL